MLFRSCCLRPGVPGLSENIRVRSILGRFLEHSRIFWFQGGADDPLDGEFLIGSADWMYRNLQTRVEAATPILRRELRSHLWDILSICLEDRRSAWEMQPDGTYRRLECADLAPDDPRAIGVHARLQAYYRDRAAARAQAMRGG